MKDRTNPKKKHLHSHQNNPPEDKTELTRRQFLEVGAITAAGAFAYQLLPAGLLTKSIAASPRPEANTTNVNGSLVKISPTAVTQSGQTTTDIAISYISENHNIPISDLRISANEPFTEVVNNSRDAVFTIVRTSNYFEQYHVVVDSSGKPTNLDEYNQTESRLYSEKYGKLSPELFEILQSKTADDKIKVDIWLTSADKAAGDAIVAKYPQAHLIGQRPSTDTDPILYEQIEKEIYEAKKHAYQASEQTIVDFAKVGNFNIFGLASSAPVVFAEMSKTTIQEISKRADVEIIYAWNNEGQLPLNTAAPTIGAPQQWGFGFTGSGIKIAIIEPDAINFNHPYLMNSNGGYFKQSNDPEFSFYFSGGVGDNGHATMCAGCIASRHSLYKGIASIVILLSGNTGMISPNNGRWGDNDFEAATDWAISQGADIIIPEAQLFGDGQTHFLDRYYDHVAYNHYRTVIVPAGNQGDKVTSPALGYNQISVGNFDHNHTTWWSDDTMHVTSRYGNPLDGREKPEVAAPGVNIMTTSSATLDFVGNEGGTSFSAPMVAGEAALLMQQNSTLKLWPELARAVIMASADHNIEGDNRLGPGDGKDGVGGIDIETAGRILNGQQFAYGTIRPSDFDTQNKRYYPIGASAGERIRVAVCWDAHPIDGSGYPYQYPILSTNFDLSVFAPDGRFIQDSTSPIMNFQILDFIADMDGQYNVVLHNSAMLEGWEWYGIAWVKASSGHFRAKADFDGDGKTDIGIFRPSTDWWYIVPSSGGPVININWAAAGDIPVIADFDGDGKTDIGVYRPSTGWWYILKSSDNLGLSYNWGAPGDAPILGDFDGDGKTDVGVFTPSTNYWSIRLSSGGTKWVNWGATGDILVPGDYDGDGKTDIAVYRPSTGWWYIQKSSDNGSLSYNWGLPGDIPVMGDFDGDGKTDIAIYRPSTNYWCILLSSGGTKYVNWGATGDILVPGDYDGDGKTDIAVFRPSTGWWYIQRSSDNQPMSYNWGVAGDAPVPSLG